MNIGYFIVINLMFYIDSSSLKILPHICDVIKKCVKMRDYGKTELKTNSNYDI